MKIICKEPRCNVQPRGKNKASGYCSKHQPSNAPTGRAAIEAQIAELQNQLNVIDLNDFDTEGATESELEAFQEFLGRIRKDSGKREYQDDINTDAYRMAQLVGVKPGGAFGGVARFHNLDAQNATDLYEEGFLNLDDRQNESPTVGEMLEWVQENPDGYIHGYMVEPGRNDYRVSFEGVGRKATPEKPITAQEVMEFTNLFRHADSFEVSDDELYAWWD